MTKSEVVVSDDDAMETRSVACANLAAVLIEAIEEQPARIEKLEAKLDDDR